MTIRSTLTDIIAAGGDPDAVARTIIGFLSCECSLDNGNGWYDDDPEMSESDEADPDAESGLSKAENAWLTRGHT